MRIGHFQPLHLFAGGTPFQCLPCTPHTPAHHGAEQSMQYNNRRLPIGATYPVQLLFFYYSRLVPDGTVRFYFLFEHPLH